MVACQHWKDSGRVVPKERLSKRCFLKFGGIRIPVHRWGMFGRGRAVPMQCLANEGHFIRGEPAMSVGAELGSLRECCSCKQIGRGSCQMVSSCSDWCGLLELEEISIGRQPLSGARWLEIDGCDGKGFAVEDELLRCVSWCRDDAAPHREEVGCLQNDAFLVAFCITPQDDDRMEGVDDQLFVCLYGALRGFSDLEHGLVMEVGWNPACEGKSITGLQDREIALVPIVWDGVVVEELENIQLCQLC